MIAVIVEFTDATLDNTSKEDFERELRFVLQEAYGSSVEVQVASDTIRPDGC